MSEQTASAPGKVAVILPLRVTVAPVQRLALIPFDRHADHVYEGLEPQYIDRGDECGWRVLAYRHDGHVDIYDDATLTLDPTERSSATGKGVRRHVTTLLDDARIDRDDEGRAHISVAFTDLYGRRIRVAIDESTTRRSTPTGLLAPVGSGAARPGFFPLFLLHDLDFVRRFHSDLRVTIDDRAIAVESFPAPLPLQGQRRTFVKLAQQVDIIQVFPTDEHRLRTVTVTDGVHQRGEVAYHFDGAALSRIVVRQTEIQFHPPLDLGRAGKGRVEMISRPGMGVVGGNYRVKSSRGTARFTLQIDKVRTPRQPFPSYRIFVNDRTIFGRWPKRYRFAARYDLRAGTVDGRWSNRREPEGR
ncbi:hypothetical protein ACTQ49_05125 [Luteococcus sp. Sow4_B9]|uniref:hypothetical protein n=1 Tax=Luteococcus sp. Sow4_B9 TaxID=3438792 RepID=UPI003F98523C